jgi:phosphatidylinositol-4-phosphate 3-kinase
MIEMVTNAETLRKIQVELGLTGSFKDRPIAEWLAKHNPSALEYERAVDNFTGKNIITKLFILISVYI